MLSRLQLVQGHQLRGRVHLFHGLVEVAGERVHVLAGERVHETGAHVRQQGEVQFSGLCLVVVHVLHELAVLSGGDAQSFGQGGAGQHDLLGQLRKEGQPGGLLGKKAQLHVFTGLRGKVRAGVAAV